MGTICQLCGGRGFFNALIDCEKCNAYSIHRYCLDVLPKTFDEYVSWFCDDCELTKPTLDKSKVLTPGKSIFGSPELLAQKQLENKIKKKAKKKLKKNVKGESEGLNKSIANTESSTSQGSPPTNHLIVPAKKKLKKKVKGESECLNKSIANTESSTSQGSPPTNHLIGTHFRDACEGTKGEMQIELYQEDGANSVENTSHFLEHGQSSAEPPVDPVWKESLCVRDKKSKKKLKKKVKDEIERVNKSIASAELSKSLGSPPNDHLIETHLGDNCEGTKGERQMEMCQEDRAISVENTSDFLSHGQSSAQPLIDPVGSLLSRDKKAMKNGKKKVEDESERANKSIANADLLKSQGSRPNNHLINASLEDTGEGTKSEMQMELCQGNRAISVENTSYFLDHGHFPAEPLVDPVWRGSLRLKDKKFGTIGLAAHLSTLACSQAAKEAKLLPIVISAELLHRFHVWPKGFGKWGPTDESIAMFFFPAKREVEAGLMEYKPDIIISVHPLMQHIPLWVLKWQGLQKKVIFVTIITDLNSCHRTWFHPGVNRCYCPSQEVAKRALVDGLEDSQIRVFGLPIRPSFARAVLSKEELREELQMDPDLPAVLLMGGGEGMGPVEKTAKALGESLFDNENDKPIGQLIIICGKYYLFIS